MSNNNGGQPSTIDLLLMDLKNPFASQVQVNSIFVALGLSLGVMAVVAILFSVIRPHHNAVYAPKLKHADKRHAPPPIGNGVFSWVDPIVKTKEMDLVDKMGMDGAIFLRFTRMLRNIFLILAVVGCAILIPVHIIFSKEVSPQTVHKRQGATGTAATSVSAEYLYKLTPRSVFGPPMWAHVVFAWIADIVIMLFLWFNYRAVARLRKKYFESPEYQNSVHGRSLMIRDVSKANRSDQGVLKIVDSVTQVASIPRTAIARNMKELPELLEEHDHTVRKLESVLAKYLKNPDKLPINRPVMRAPGKARGKIDAIDYLTNRIQDLEVRIRDVRDTIDSRNPEPYGFASYESMVDAHQVAWQARKKKAMGSKITLAPSPRDIIWKNMRLSPAARSRKRFVANFWVAVLTAFYIVPNAFIAIFLANLANLAAIWKGFGDVYNNQNNQVLFGVLQAILAPALFSLFYLILPSIFRRISERAGDHTKTSRERHVTHKLYAFFVFNNLIVFSIFSALWAFGSAIIESAVNKQDVLKTLKDQSDLLPGVLLNTVCNVSPFWVVWLLQRNIGAAVDLAQLWNMFLRWFNRTFLAPTPRELIELTAPPPFDYASYYNYFLYYATVGTVFAPIQPLVLVVVLLYFLIDCVLKKYLLLYVFITKTESGGQFWNVVHNRMLFSCLLQNLIGALVIYGAQGSWTQIICMAPLPLILLVFKIWIGRTLANQARFHTRGVQATEADAEALTDSKKRIKHVSSRLLNPVMTKPLITPMVHAKSKHLLAQVYRGRMEDVDEGHDGPAGYGQIPLSDMSGKPTNNITDMFEVVHENELDFAHFKERAEFRDQFGGGGELYGRGFDAMTERSATPASFMTGDSGSDAGSIRAGTPEPMPGSMHPAFRNQHQGPYGNNPAQGFNVASAQHMRNGSFASSQNVRSGSFAAAAAAHRSDSFGNQSDGMYAPPPRPGFFRQGSSADSARRLVGAAQPVGYAPVGTPTGITPGEELSEGEMYNMDRWRSAGSGYNPIRGEYGDSNYDSYRRPGQH